MAISRFQMNRQLRAYGGMMGDDGRKAYGIGSFFQKKIMDPIKNIVKSDAGKAATAAALGYGLNRFGIPKTSGISGTGENIGKGSITNIFSLFKSKAISSNATTELLTQPLVMEASEALKVQASDANELHVVASILEIEPREETT